LVFFDEAPPAEDVGGGGCGVLLTDSGGFGGAGFQPPLNGPRWLLAFDTSSTFPISWSCPRTRAVVVAGFEAVLVG
jgi:hypothetical protein